MFIKRENIEPTNNIAERAIPPVVMLRKTSLRSMSDRGRRFVERMQTASATLKKTGHSPHDFIWDRSRRVARATLAEATGLAYAGMMPLRNPGEGR